MLERLANTFIAGIELLEAEGRVVHKRATALVGQGALLLVLVALTLGGVLTLAVGATWLLALSVGTPIALCIAGGAVALAAGWGAYEAHHRMSR